MKCILYPEREECIGCNDCRCDLDPDKICDNCMACERSDGEFRSILIDRIEMNENSKSQP